MSTSTLSELAQNHPAPTPEQVKALLADADPARLVSWGKRFASERILTDTSRLYGIAAAVWAKATDDQKDVLVGFSDEVLAVAVHTALKLQNQLAAFKAHKKTDHIRREATSAELGDSWTVGMRKRALAGKALAPIAGEDPGREAELAGVLGTVDGPEALAQSLDLLAGLAQKWSKDKSLAVVVKMTRIDTAWVARVQRAAKTLREAAAAEMSRMTVQVSQGDLDKLDGENLYLLKLIVELFDAAHDEDPTIRRLNPISTARFFNSRRKTGKTTDKEEADIPDEVDDELESDG